MKKYIKFIAIILACIAVMVVFIGKYEQKASEKQTYVENALKECKNNPNDDCEKRNSQMEELVKLNDNFFTSFFEIIYNYLYPVCYVFFLIINSFALWKICSSLKNKTFTNKILFESYKYIFILPLCIGILIVYGILFKNFYVDYDIASQTFWKVSTLNNYGIFLFLYIIEVILFSIAYINMGIIIARKIKNYFLTLISSYILFVGFEYVLEHLQNVIYKIAPYYWVNYINMWNILQYDDSCGMLAPLVFPLLLCIISTMLVFILYKNKEKLNY